MNTQSFILFSGLEIRIANVCVEGRFNHSKVKMMFGDRCLSIGLNFGDIQLSYKYYYTSNICMRMFIRFEISKMAHKDFDEI